MKTTRRRIIVENEKENIYLQYISAEPLHYSKVINKPFLELPLDKYFRSMFK